jgi:hypothetical protein
VTFENKMNISIDIYFYFLKHVQIVARECELSLFSNNNLGASLLMQYGCPRSQAFSTLPPNMEEELFFFFIIVATSYSCFNHLPTHNTT